MGIFQGRQDIGNKKKRLVGSKTAMLQDSPLMVDAPTFDTTLPAFEEAHNTSKHLKTFQEASAPRWVNSSNQEKTLGESLWEGDLSNDGTLPGLQVKDKSTNKQRPRISAKLTEPSIKPRMNSVDAATKKSPKAVQSRRQLPPINVSQAN